MKKAGRRIEKKLNSSPAIIPSGHMHSSTFFFLAWLLELNVVVLALACCYYEMWSGSREREKSRTTSRTSTHEHPENKISHIPSCPAIMSFHFISSLLHFPQPFTSSRPLEFKIKNSKVPPEPKNQRTSSGSLHRLNKAPFSYKYVIRTYRNRNRKS